jgi:predicted RNA methylase
LEERDRGMRERLGDVLMARMAHRCGWGSGALYFAEVLPKAQVTAFSNSRTQKEYIDSRAKEKGLANLTVITGDIVDYEFEPESFDRVVSIEVRYPLSPSLSFSPLHVRHSLTGAEAV